MVREKQLIFVFGSYWLIFTYPLCLRVLNIFFFPYKHLLNCTSNGPHDELVRQLLTFLTEIKYSINQQISTRLTHHITHISK